MTIEQAAKNFARAVKLLEDVGICAPYIASDNKIWLFIPSADDLRNVNGDLVIEKQNSERETWYKISRVDGDIEYRSFVMEIPDWAKSEQNCTTEVL